MIVALDATCIRCPQCQGDGYYEIGDVDGQAAARCCPVCTPDRDRLWGFPGPGRIELPISPEIAERIYTHAATDSETYDLVYDAQAVDEQWERERQAEREAEAAAEDSITALARARRLAEEREIARADALYDLRKDDDAA